MKNRLGGVLCLSEPQRLVVPKEILMPRLTPNLPIQQFWSGPCLLALLSIFLTGCANSCIVGGWNPPNGTIGVVAGNPPPTCALTKATGALRLVLHSNRSCEFCSASNRVHSAILSLKGIDVRSSANATDESSAWQELLPQLETQPIQIHLLDEGTNSLRTDSLTERVLVPAGTYDLLRLRFASNQSGEIGEIPTKNACGRVGLNCVLMADGQIEPLVFAEDKLESSFASESAAVGLLVVLPGTESELHIELTPAASIGASFEKGARIFSLVPDKTSVAKLPWVE
jgi:Domain of unknown function (DUF4382)